MAKERKTLNKIYEEQNSTGYTIGQRWFDSMTLKNVISEAYNDDSFEKEIGFARVDEWGVIALIGEDLIYNSNNAQIGQKFSIISNGNLYRVDYINFEIADTFEVKNSVVNIVDVDSLKNPSIKVGDTFKTFSLVDAIYRVKYRKSDLTTGVLDIRLYNGELSTLGYYEHLKVYSADMLQVWDVSTSAMKYSPNSTVNSFMQAIEENLTSNIMAEKVLYNSTTSVKEELDKKVNKSDTANILYGTDNAGAQTLLYQAIGNTGNTIVKRDANGNFGVGLTPTQDYHATSKKYVDDKNEMCVKVEEDLPPAPNQIIVSAGDKRTVKSSNVNIDNIATKIEITAIYEKLEGKKNTYILDTSMTLSIIKQEIKFGRDVVIEDANGNNINQAIEEGRYDNIWLTNSSFNSNNNRILDLPSSDQYLFVYKTQTDQTDSTINNTKRILFNLNDVLMEVGDIILITQTDVPDRWFGGRQYGFYTLETRKVDLSAGAISFDNSNIVKNYTFEWNGGVYVYKEDENYPGYSCFNSGASFIINPSYQTIYLEISKQELLSHDSDFTYSGIVYYTPVHGLESITGDTILVKRPRWGKNVQTIVEQLAQEHTEFEELGEIVKNNMIVLKDTDNYEFSPSDRAQHSYLISCVSGWQNIVGVAHIVKQLVFSDKYVLDINFFGINVHNGGDKSPFYNIKTTINAGGPSSNPEYFTLTGLVSGNVVTSAILSKCTPENIVGADLNVENGTGTNAIQMKQDGDSGVFDFTGKNPKATEIDETLTGEIPYGATGNFATVLGGKASAQGKRSMAQGTTTIAKGNYSHAEGDNSVALGNDSHAEGYQTTASGQFAHSEGEQTLASGKGAHATGHNTIAEGEFSSAHGYYTYANQPAQQVVGMFNDLESAKQALFVVGNGTYDHLRSNALMVFKDGHAEVKESGSTPKSVVIKEELNEVITNINEKLEGKKNTFIINTTYTIQVIKDLITNAGIEVENSQGTDITRNIINGEYDSVEIVNNLLNSNESFVSFYNQSKYIFVLKATSDNLFDSGYSETYILDSTHKIFNVGDIILTTETNIPDRWYGGYGAGYPKFYALESRKSGAAASTDASEIIYNDIGNNLGANVQAAIDKLNDKVENNNEILDHRIERTEDAIDDLNLKKANKDGYYSQLHSGLADNLASPDGVVNEEPYVFRPTAGTTSVTDGYATIKKLKGNTIVSPIRKSVDLGTIIPFDITDDGVIKYRKIHIDAKGAPYNKVANIHIEGYTAASIRDVDNRTSDMIIASSDANEYQALWLYNTAFAGKTKTEVQQLLSGVILTYDSIENELVHARPQGIKTVGFNAFDGEMEEGGIVSTGNPYNDFTRIRSKNFIKVIGGQTYTWSEENKGGWSNRYLREYDSEKNYIGVKGFGNYTNPYSSFQLSDNCRYVKLEYYNNANTTLLPNQVQNICFHLTHSGYRNGEFEDYWSETREINFFKCFPNNYLKSAGSAYDEITPTKAIKRIEVVDLGTLDSWYYDTTYKRFYNYVLENNKPNGNTTAKANILCSKYISGTLFDTKEDSSVDKVIALYNKAIYIKDTAYTDAATFKNSLSGVMLAYELETPIETDIEQTRDVNWDYRISDFGTEEFITSSIAPVAHETFYMANLRDEVRNLPKNYISKKSFDNFTSALSSALGISISATYNETTKSYDFSIVKSVEE